MLSQIKGGFEALIEGLFINRDIVSEQEMKDERETKTILWKRFNAEWSAKMRGITSIFHWKQQQNLGSRLTKNKTNAVLFESRVTQEKPLGRKIPIKKYL